MNKNLTIIFLNIKIFPVTPASVWINTSSILPYI